jgi:hypothetical protein
MFSKLKTSIIVVTVCVSALFAQQFGGNRGDIWTGGSFNFVTAGSSGGGDRENLFTLCPILRFFPVTGLCLGPRISWMGEFWPSFDINVFAAGMDIGYVGKANVISYLLTSPHYAFLGESSSGLSISSSSLTVFYLPFSAGVIIPVGQSLGIQLEAGYSIGFNTSPNQGSSSNAFSIGIGVCGLGEKLAVSVVNTLNLMSSAF